MITQNGHPNGWPLLTFTVPVIVREKVYLYEMDGKMSTRLSVSKCLEVCANCYKWHKSNNKNCRLNGPYGGGGCKRFAREPKKPLTPDQQSTLWIGATRYYMGRMSYAVPSFCDLLKQEWDRLPKHTQDIIRRDLMEEFERDDRARAEGWDYKPLGHDCDRVQWESVKKMIDEGRTK